MWHGVVASGNDPLHNAEGFTADHRHMPSDIFFAIPRIADNSGVERIAENVIDGLFRKRHAGARAKSAPRQQAQDLRFGVSTGGKFDPTLLQNAERGLIGLIRLGFLAVGARDAFVAERRSPRENSFLNLAAHPLHGSRGANIVIELCKTCQDRFQQAPFRFGINGFSNGDNAYAVFQETGFDIEVVADIAREAVHLPDE